VTAGPSGAVHRILCPDCKRNGASNVGVGLGGNGSREGGEAAEGYTDLLNHEWIIPEGPTPGALIVCIIQVA
jgi:hypothetical protein